MFRLVPWFIIAVVLVRLFVVQVYVVSGDSMLPTLHNNQKVTVWKTARVSGIHRQDVVVFDGAGVFSESSPQDFLGWLVESFGLPKAADRLFVKRVIGVGGDRVHCCTAAGLIEVNGKALAEPYLAVGMAPSATQFDVIVPDQHLWVMGDNRSASFDSRALLGRPGGGMVPTDAVVGRINP